MQSMNMNDFDRQYFDSKNTLQSHNSFDSLNDRPRGWSYICFDETVNYYTKHNQNTENLVDKE